MMKISERKHQMKGGKNNFLITSCADNTPARHYLCFTPAKILNLIVFIRTGMIHLPEVCSWWPRVAAGAPYPPDTDPI